MSSQRGCSLVLCCVQCCSLSVHFGLVLILAHSVHLCSTRNLLSLVNVCALRFIARFPQSPSHVNHICWTNFLLERSSVWCCGDIILCWESGVQLAKLHSTTFNYIQLHSTIRCYILHCRLLHHWLSKCLLMLKAFESQIDSLNAN